MPEEKLPATEDGKDGAAEPRGNAAAEAGLIKRLDEKLVVSRPLRWVIIAVFAGSLVALVVIISLHLAGNRLGGAGYYWGILAGALLLVSAAGLYVVLKQKREVRSVKGQLQKREEANRRLALLLGAGRELGSTLDRENILAKTLEFAIESVGGSLGAVYLPTRQSYTLDLAMTRGVDENKMMFRQLPIGKGLIGEAAAARRVLFIEDTSHLDERDNVFFGSASVRALAVVPLLSGDKFTGLLVIADTGAHKFSDDEKAILRGLAELASLSISNAELYRIARRSLDVAAQQRGFADSVLDSMVAGVMTADKNGRIAVFNQEAQRLTGYAFAEMTQVMLRPELSLEENPLGALEQGMLDVLDDPTILREGDALIMKKDGSIFPVSYRVYPLSDGVEVLGSASVFMESGSDSKGMAREDMDYQLLLRSLGARIERLYTHPLTRVLDRVKGMDVESWGRSRDDLTKILEAGSAALLGLLEDVEQYLNCITTREWDSKEEHDVSSIVTDVVDGLMRTGAHRGVVVVVNLSSPPPVFGYGRMIKTALEEVIENAMIASAEGGKRVEVTGREVDGRVRIEIRDSGPGIPADEGESIFRPFFTMREGTSGLGLSTVERVMERLGGSTGFASETTGCVFYLDFPKVKSSPNAEEAPTGTVTGGGERS